jgi:hypothetical protein
VPRSPLFLPLAQRTVTACAAEHLGRPVRQAEARAVDCWTGLLSGGPLPYPLLERALRVTVDELAGYAGAAWWTGAGSWHRQRVIDARSCVLEAAAEADGPEFATAFLRLDDVLATAVMAVSTRPARASAPTQAGSPEPTTAPPARRTPRTVGQRTGMPA